jgi:transcriptional regulator with PAS, ATPase and Fis domain
MTTPSADPLKHLLAEVKPMFAASLDPVVLLDAECKIVHASASMRKVLGLKGKDAGVGAKFCDQITLSICAKGCKIQEVLRTGHAFRLDEVPASRGDEKLRLIVSAAPVMGGADKKAIGAIVSVRDTTAEVLLQAKYHKVMQMLGSKDDEINELAKRLDTLRQTLRDAAVSSRTR